MSNVDHAHVQSLNCVRSIMLWQIIGKNDKLTCHSEVINLRLLLTTGEPKTQVIFYGANPYAAVLGCKKIEKKILEPVWSCRSIFLSFLVDLLEKTFEKLKDKL